MGWMALSCVCERRARRGGGGGGGGGGEAERVYLSGSFRKAELRALAWRQWALFSNLLEELNFA